VVFDESVFPFSTHPATSTPQELDIFSVFPTDAVVEPPFQLSPAGTPAPDSSPEPCPSSPAASVSPDPAPYSTMEGPSGGGGLEPPPQELPQAP
jgi:hypothetical protein